MLCGARNGIPELSHRGLQSEMLPGSVWRIADLPTISKYDCIALSLSTYDPSIMLMILRKKFFDINETIPYYRFIIK